MVQRAQQEQSLGAVEPGQEFEVVGAFLNDPDPAFAEPRLGVGRRWRCDFSGETALVLTDFAGQTVRVMHDDARFVQVRLIE